MLRDDAFMMPAAPAPLRRLSGYELATLEGVGDRGYEAARADVWRVAGPQATANAYVAPFAIGDEVYYRVAEVEGEGRIARIDHDEFLLETEPGAYARVAAIYCAHKGRVKRTEEHKRAVRHALGTSSVQEVVPLQGGDAIVRVAYRVGLKPDEAEVRELVAARLPHAAILDAHDHGTHLDVVVHHGPSQLALQRSAEALASIGRRAGRLDVRERAVEKSWTGAAVSHFTVEFEGRPAFVNVAGQLTPMLAAGSIPASGRVEVQLDGRVAAFLHSATGDIPIDLDADVSLEAKQPSVSQLSARDYERMKVQHGGPSAQQEAEQKRREEEAAKRRRQQNQGPREFEPHQLGAEHIGGPGLVVAQGPGLVVAEHAQALGARAAQVLAMLSAPFDPRVAASPLTQSLLHSRQRDPNASSAVDRLVVEYLTRSPEALDRIAPGVYGSALDAAVQYWGKMDPKKLESVRSKYAPEQDPTDMRGAPSAWSKFTDAVSTRRRLEREIDTGAAEVNPSAPSRAPAAPAAANDGTKVDKVPAGSIAPQSTHTLPAGTPIQGQDGKSSKLPAATPVKVLKVEGNDVLVMAPGNKFLVVPSGAFARAAARTSVNARFRTAATWEGPEDREGADKVPARGNLGLRHEKYRRKGKRLAVDVLWEASVAKAMTPGQLEQCVISYCKSLPANDVGMVGSVRVVALDPAKGRATATFASSNQAQYPREEYA